MLLDFSSDILEERDCQLKLRGRSQRRRGQAEVRRIEELGLTVEEIHELKRTSGRGGQANFEIDWNSKEVYLGSERII